MARYYRRRYTRVIKPKRKWASNITTFASTPIVINEQGIGYSTLVTNPQQSASPTPTVLKTGNFKVSIDTVVNYTQATSANIVFQMFIVYVPEGWSFSNLAGIVSGHPEWIMASKTVGGSFATGTAFSLETLNVSSRLKRNLNSGDSVLLMYVPNEVTAGATMLISGHVRYWTCAN